MSAATQEWLRLQRLIFTRWANQRLARRRIPPMADVVADLAKNNNLVNLLEILSERPCPHKMKETKIAAIEVGYCSVKPAKLY